jgi:hypothetical protein
MRPKQFLPESGIGFRSQAANLIGSQKIGRVGSDVQGSSADRKLFESPRLRFERQPIGASKFDVSLCSFRNRRAHSGHDRTIPSASRAAEPKIVEQELTHADQATVTAAQSGQTSQRQSGRT